jgi:hypothetical protein
MIEDSGICRFEYHAFCQLRATGSIFIYDRGGGIVRIFLMSALVAIALFMASLSSAEIDPGNVVNGHVWLFEDGSAKDSSKNNLNGTIVGNPKLVRGVNGDALEFDGESDLIKIPDSADLNTGTFTNRTVKIIFNCADVSINDKQTLFEEGGRTRGLVVYVFDGEVYVGAWNRAEYNWNGAWISEPIQSNRWYEVAAIIRDAKGAVEKDKFEMWLDGRLIDKESGGQLHSHSDNNGIGAVNQNTVFHDEDGSQAATGWYFWGLIDEVWVLNQALTAADLGSVRPSLEPLGRLDATWGSIKAQH